MTSSTKSILDYQQKALESIPKDHPHKEEIIKLLNEQVNDDLHSQNGNTITNR